MVSAEKRSVAWNIARIYDAPSPDRMDSAGFFEAFAEFHDINGHRIECILTRPKYAKPVVNVFSQNDTPGIVRVDAVLIVRLADMSGMRQGESLKVDGQVYVIQSLKFPLNGIAKMELSGVAV